MIPYMKKVKCPKCGYWKVVKQDVIMSICPSCQVEMPIVEFEDLNKTGKKWVDEK